MFLTSAKRDEISKLSPFERRHAKIIIIDYKKVSYVFDSVNVDLFTIIKDDYDTISKPLVHGFDTEQEALEYVFEYLNDYKEKQLYSSSPNILKKLHEKRNNKILALASARIPRLGRKSPIKKMGRDLLGLLKEFL